VGWWVIRDIEKYFSEMTSVVYKIDEANKMWEIGHWFKDEQFYPNKFRIYRDRRNPLAPDTANVTRDAIMDPVLIGWHDPTIKRFRHFTIWLMILNGLFYCSLLFLGHQSS